MSRNLRYASARDNRSNINDNINVEIMLGLFAIAGFLLIAGSIVSHIPSDNSTRQPTQSNDTTIIDQR